jgi:ABC-type bacteriocin/lantibiotic exporter with double-glycine peptidase domain
MPRVCITALLWLSCTVSFAMTGSTAAWLDVPFVHQQEDGCGAASIATPPGTSAEYGHIQSALFSPAAHGILASDMVRYFQQNGFSAFAFTGDWDLLQHHIAAGRPLIVALQPGSHLPRHYVVVVGVDQQAHVVFLNDPAERKLQKEDHDRFEREWKAADCWTLLAVPESHKR